jgi:dipeptidyl aminopeptidase/acylaminoacyl peptidase
MARSLTPDDMIRFRWLRDGRLSPDGRMAVYEVARFVPPEKPGDDPLPQHTEVSDLFLLDIDAGSTRRLTSADTVDSGARFSPDGRTVAFVRKLGDTTQIFSINVDGGEPVQLTRLPQGATAPCWSPDGSLIAFTATVDRGESPPDRSRDPYRVTRNVWRFDAIGDLDLAVTNVHLLEIGSGETRQLTSSETRDSIVGFTPDGSRLVITASMAPDTFRAMGNEITVLDLEGGTTTIVPHAWGNVGVACLTPDGEHVLFNGRADDGAPIGTHQDLWRVATDGSDSPECLSCPGTFDVMGSLEGRIPAAIPNRIFVKDDGGELLVNSQIGGTVPLFALPLSPGAEPREITGGERCCMLVDAAGGRLLYIADDINSPPDLFCVNDDGTDDRRLTDLNADVMGDLVPLGVEQLSFSGTDGTPVEGWYVKPQEAADGASGPWKTILWIHGGPHGGQGHRFSFDTWVLAGAGYGVMFVNHRASTGYGDEFATAIKGDWGNLDYGDLMAGVDEAIARGLADPDLLGCCGISGGGNLSCWIVGNTDRFRAAVPQNPVTNWVSFYGVSDIGVWFSVEQLGGHPHEIPDIYANCSPITWAHRCTTPVLLIQNEADWRCPPEQSEQFYTVLRANGCPVEMVRHPAAAHSGSVRGPFAARVSHLRETLGWFDRWIV